MTRIAHLTEDERQSAADGTLAADRLHDVSGHLSTCASCAADVTRLTTLMTRLQETPASSAALEDQWPSIRSRIEQSKVVRLDAPHGLALAPPLPRRPWIAAVSTALAAGIVIAAFAQIQSWRPGATRTPPSAADVSFASVADSTLAYEAEAKTLLNELEMQRAMLRPNASAALDSDLLVIDRSIAELKDALARDPHNIALQRLLAASYREKVELLKRANNAG